ncbi:MAG TPA: hypothetical protein VMU09_02390 [Acidimicrobiales bacterium]|nr:hypothetical protein [Acidimicrobiales bacterium]
MATTPKNARLEDVFDLVAKREAEVMTTARTWMRSVGDTLPVEFPLVQELTREFLDFTEELLRIQREFARDLLAETHALMHRVSAGGVPTTTAHHEARPASATKARKSAA